MNKFISGLLGVAAVTGVLVGASPAQADTCKSVDIKVKNNKSTKILALSVDYRFKEDGVERHESFSNTEVAAGQTKTVALDQNLPGGEGNNMQWMKLHFKVWCGPSQTSGSWSQEYVSQADSTFLAPVCKSNSGKHYVIELPATDQCGGGN